MSSYNYYTSRLLSQIIDHHYPHVRGGAEIVSDGMVKVSVTSSTATSISGTVRRSKGTLGCVAINQAATDARKKAVALTNAHVLLDVVRTTTHDGEAEEFVKYTQCSTRNPTLPDNPPFSSRVWAGV